MKQNDDEKDKLKNGETDNLKDRGVLELLGSKLPAMLEYSQSTKYIKGD